MGISKIDYYGENLIDLTGDTVTAETLMKGTTAHNAAGDRVAGTYEQYAVGDIFISTVDTSPAARFGGAWEQIKDVFLLAAGDTYAAGASGGSATHALTDGEMPAHEHLYTAWSDHIATLPPQDTFRNAIEVLWENHWAQADGLIWKNGNNLPFSIMPPYLTVYIWKRIA